MNLKFILKTITFSLLSKIVLAKDDCEEINIYINNIDSNYMYGGCNINEKGEVVDLNIQNVCMPDKIAKKFFSYDTIKSLEYSINDDDKSCFEGFPNSITNLKNLERLKILGSKNLTIDYSILKNFPLKELSIKIDDFTQKSIDDIASINTLEYLDLNDVNIGDFNINSLKTHKKLNNLRLRNNDIEKVSFIGFINLKKLEIGSTSQSIVDSIANIINLEELYLNDGNNLNLDALKKLKKLTKLSASANSIQIGTLKGFKYLKNIYLEGDVKQEYIDDISTIKTLEAIDIFDFSVDNLSFEGFKNLSNLTKLQIRCSQSKYENISFVVAKNSFIYLKSLKQLTINGFGLTQDNLDEISSLNSLDKITFEYCNIQKELKFDKFRNLTNLSSLEILKYEPLGSPLYEIPESFYSLTNLKKLVINQNKITKISEKLANLINLEYLDLSDNLIDDKIPESLNNLSNLKYVNFRLNTSIRGKTLINQKLETCIYDESSFLCKVMDMNCFEEGYTFDSCSDSSSSKFKDSCEEIRTYLYEKKLNDEEVIEECIIEEGKITKLKIDDAKITENDVKKILSFNSIETLYIYWNGNQNTINSVSDLSNLKYLYLFSNTGGELNLEPLNKLKELNTLEVSCPYSKNYSIKDNSLKGLKAIKKLMLKEFIISQTNINEISTLTNLEELVLNHCSFTINIDYNSLTNLKKLTSLDIVSYNNYGEALYEIPSFIFSLSSLKKLTLTHHKINIISDKIENLKNIEILNFSNNNIIRISDALNKLPKLKSINFSGNANITGKTLINSSLETCIYDNSSSLCKAKEMSCFGKDDLLKPCTVTVNKVTSKSKATITKTIAKTITKVKRLAPTNW